MSDEITPNPQTTQTELQIEPISEPIQVTEVPTAQIPANEPLDTEKPEVETTPEELPPSATLPEEKPLASSSSETSESKTSEPETIETKPEPEKEIIETKTETKPDPEPEQTKVIPVIISKKNIARELLIKARNAIQSRKRKKLDKVMTLFLKKNKITNDEVEKFMHVSDATAERYLNTLEKENKIKQAGKTGKFVFYSKI